MGVRPGAPAGDTTPIASERVTALLANNAGTNDVAAANIGKNIAVVAPTTYVAPSGTCGVVAGTFINAPCGTGAGLGTGGSSTGTAESNTATMESVMNVVSQAASATAPYVVQGTAELAGGNDKNIATQLASLNTAITVATRGESVYVAGSDYTKKTPTGCIGPNVYFSNPVAVIANSKKMVYTFCNPDGYKGVARSDFTLANNINLYTLPAGTQVNGVDTYAKTVFGGATKDMTSAVSPGTMCPAHGSGNGKTAKTVANIGLDNPALKELLEGQAFYAALAPSQYDIPTTSTTAATQTANAKKQKMCAEHITDMMKLSKVAANTPGTGAAGTISTFANSYSAVEFPLWKVAVGASDSAVYTVMNKKGCTATTCTAAGILNTTGAIPV